jgi:Zn-dependent peptidase ImmA (M78 family)
MTPKASKRSNAHRAARIHHAEQRAVEILAKLRILRAPVPVEKIALQLGLLVKRAAFGDDVSGLLVVQDGRGVIGINAAHSSTRQRFTIAHELGHFVLHPSAMPVFIDKSFLKPYFTAFRNSTSATGEDRIEREANSFAAALLMPAELVHQAIAELSVDLADDDEVDELAKRFQVSRQAMSFRLANLAISDEKAARR